VEAVQSTEDDKSRGRCEYVRLQLTLEEMGARPHEAIQLHLATKQVRGCAMSIFAASSSLDSD
jgi:hypothetical protein